MLKWCKLSVSGYVLKVSGEAKEMFFKTKGELTTYLIRKDYTDFENATKFVDELIKNKKWLDYSKHWGNDEAEDDLTLFYSINQKR